MNKTRVSFSILLLLLLALVACGGAAPAVDSVAVDLSTLPDAVDVATVQSLKGDSEVVVIDVREQWEYDAGHIPGVTLIPMNDVPARLSEIPTDKTVIVTCRSGNRSGQVTNFLRDQGYDNVHNMEGGILAWEAAGYSVEQ
jgi:rhodanese-related sulfurtransferase